jgi:DNA-binding transcriptional ArsR family regulator
MERHSGAEVVDLSELSYRPLRVTQSALPSVLALLSDALGARRHGAPEPWRRAVKRSLERSDVAALVPVFGDRRILLPDCLTPIPAAGKARIEDTLEQIAATDPDELLRQAASEYGGDPPRAWQYVEARPRVWLRAYARALGKAAGAIAPVWRAAAPLLDRETERIGTASALGSGRELLGGLHANGRLEGERLLLERQGSEPVVWTLPSAGLALVPMLGGTGSLVSWHRGDELTHLAYPVPGRLRLVDVPDPRTEPLDGLLGGPRALILRVLDEPATAGAIATALCGVPGSATYHVTALESAGLVVRERRGQRVLVHRTARGTALLGLYER